MSLSYLQWLTVRKQHFSTQGNLSEGILEVLHFVLYHTDMYTSLFCTDPEAPSSSHYIRVDNSEHKKLRLPFAVIRSHAPLPCFSKA